MTKLFSRHCKFIEKLLSFTDSLKGRKMYLVSACLLGENCKYDGGNNRNQAVIDFLQGKLYCPVCPESLAGLPVPRPPVEIQEDERRFIDRQGRDLTEDFLIGARRALEISLDMARQRGEAIEGAILKANSPSCGHGSIYDGSFTGTLKEGNGAFAELLEQIGIGVVTEKEI